MYERILVPLDGSELAEAILPYASELGKRLGSRLILLQVVESMVQAMASMAPAEPVMLTPQAVENVVEGVESEEETAKRSLQAIAQRLAGEGLTVDWVVVAGRAGPEIVRTADERQIDLIAMSSHGRGGLERAIFGSVADHVLRHVRLPVLILPHHKEANKDRGKD